MNIIELLANFLGFNVTGLQSITGVKISFIYGIELFLLLILFLVPLFFYIYRHKDSRPIPKSIKILITTLRMTFIIFIAMIVSGLSINISGTVPYKNKIALLFDVSKSMSIQENKQSRFARIVQTIQSNDFINKIEEKTSIKPSIFSFSSSVSPITAEEILQSIIKPEGLSTNISKAIQEVIDNLGANNLAGIILFTDGCHNQGENPLDILSTNMPPIHIAYSGYKGKLTDLSLSLDRVPAIGFINSSINIRGEIKVSNLDIKQNTNNKIYLTIFKDDILLRNLVFNLSSSTEIIPFEYNLACDSEGVYKYKVLVSTFPNELTFDNNESSFVIKVVKEKIKVLVISNIMSYDLAFMRWAIKSDPSFTYDAYILVAENRWIRMKDFILDGTPTYNIDFIKDLEDTDILILAGIHHNYIAHLEKKIVKKVEDGKLGLVFLPTYKGFKPLGYEKSEFAKLFPMDIATEEWTGIPCNIMLPSLQPQYMFLKLFEDLNENMLFYKTVPKIEGVYTYSSYKPSTEFLIVSSIEKNGQNQPVLITQKFGRGRILVLCGGPIWPMGFRNVTTEKTIRPYRGFIVNMFKWLTDRKEDTNISIEIPAGRIFTDQPVVIKVFVYDDRQKPINNSLVTATIISEHDNKGTLQFTPSTEDGCYETTFIPSNKGRYKLKVSAKHQGKDLGSAESEILVEIPTIEYENTELNLDLLSKIASATNGVCIPVENCDIILNSITTSGNYKTISKSFEFKDSWFVLVIALCLPLLEWFLRRTNGLN